MIGKDAIGQALDRLPSNWPADWTHFAPDVPLMPNHRARKIDTGLAPPLSDMFKESDAGGELQRILRNLAERNLRRGHRLNIATGQAAAAAINAFDASHGAQMVEIPVLTEADLNVGAAGAALVAGDMLEATPLWYYCLREAELGGGNALGPLGSRIVAETLIGLIVQDDQSYWHRDPKGYGSSAPIKVAGSSIGDFPAMLRAGGLLV